MSEFVMPRYGAGLPKKSEQKATQIKEERPDCSKCGCIFFRDATKDTRCTLNAVTYPWVIYNTPECRAAYHTQRSENYGF